jgi:hypothetical protein
MRRRSGPATSTGIIAADTAIGTAGRATVVWSITVFADTTATFILRNGTDDTGTAFWGPETAAAVVGARHYWFPNGMFFPSGCYLDVTADTLSAALTYTQQTTS